MPTYPNSVLLFERAIEEALKNSNSDDHLSEDGNAVGSDARDTASDGESV